MSDQPREVEGVLLVSADDPEAVVRRLVALEAVDRFDLWPRPPQRIHDVNLDTADGAVGAARITLRVRKLDGRPLYTLKADARRTGLAAERLELEAPWSAETLRAALAELRRRGVQIPDPPAASAAEVPGAGAPGGGEAGAGEAGAGEPLAVLAGLGLHPGLERHTTRTPRDVHERGRPEGGTVAELAVDDVAFQFPVGVVRLLEVEVEAKGFGGLATVQVLLEGLHQQFPDELRPWPYGKAVTGRAAEQLLAAGRLQQHLDPAGRLRPAATDLLAEILAENTS